MSPIAARLGKESHFLFVGLIVSTTWVAGLFLAVFTVVNLPVPAFLPILRPAILASMRAECPPIEAQPNGSRITVTIERISHGSFCLTAGQLSSCTAFARSAESGWNLQMFINSGDCFCKAEQNRGLPRERPGERPLDRRGCDVGDAGRLAGGCQLSEG